MNYILYNPISGHGASKERAEKYKEEHVGEAELLDMTKIDDYSVLLGKMSENDDITIFGGDGTLNRFVNDIGDVLFNNKVFYFPTGTGNDFFADVKEENQSEPLEISKYLKNLPSVYVDGEKHKFINGVGYGIDGYCCEVGDKMRSEGKVANYTAIAIKGLLFHFKPRNAKVVVDGVEREYKKVWIAPTMYGRRYGGGMIPTPDQVRGGEDRELSLMVFHGSGKLKTLMIFPSIFKGLHVKETKYVEVLRGKNIKVTFDSPTALQIDGETHLGITEYTAEI